MGSGQTGIRTGIEMRDQFSSVLMGFIDGMASAVEAANRFSDTMGHGVNVSGLADARREIDSIMDGLNALNRQAAEPAVSESAEGRGGAGLEAQGVQRLNGQIEQTRALLQRVSDVQQAIGAASQRVGAIPDDAGAGVQEVNDRLLQMREAMSQISQNPFDMPTEAVEAQLASLRGRIRETLQDQLALNETLSNMDVEIERPPPVQIPVEWQADGLDVFKSSGIGRFRQEAQSANAMLERLSVTQDEIARRALHADILPPSAFQDMNSLAVRIDNVKGRIQQIGDNPLNMGTDRANRELERLRSQLAQAIQQQNEMNGAIERMDIQGANAAYLRLSQTVGGMEAHIRDNVDGQGRFNQEVESGARKANGLTDAIKGAAAAYLTVSTLKGAVNASDELVQTESRLSMMNDGLQSTQDLTNMVYAAAQDARGSFGDMAGVVARFGNNARDAFSSSEEVVQFAGLIQKQMTIAGASTQEAANAQLQLSQALGSGVLRGDELNSIFEQAPNLIQNIADYMGVPIGKIREMASEGELSADIVKQSVFAAADEINAKFDEMPMTWGQAWQSMKNEALIAFQPVLQKINDIAGSGQFQEFMDGAVSAMAFAAEAVLEVFDLLLQMGGFVADNWSVISPIIYTVVGALAAYAVYLGIVKMMEIVSAGIKIALALASFAHAAATGTEASATAAATAAQYGLNAALLSCPLTWIILAIIALIAVVITVASHIANMGGVATTTFGVICGAVAVAAAFIANIFIGLINFVITQGVNLYNMIANFAAAFGIIFNDPVAAIKTVILSMFDFVVGVAASAAKILDAIFGSNLASAVEGFQDEIQAEINETVEGSGGKAPETLNPEDYTLDRMNYGDAYKSGAEWGDGISNKLSDALNKNRGTEVMTTLLPSQVANSGNGAAEAANAGQAKNSAATARNTGDTAEAAQKAAQSLDVTGENVKYIKDMAERDYVNRFTTAKITVKQTNHNTVKNNMDLDGINEYLRSDLEQRMAATAEGVH